MKKGYEMFDVVSIVVLIVLAPVLVRFIDRAYVASKKTKLGKDLEKVLKDA